MAKDKQSTLHDRVGLCHTCAHHRLIESAKGSVFYLCKLSERDPRYPKYPRLPVLKCEGFEEQPGASSTGRAK